MSDLVEFLRARCDEDERGVHEWAQPRPDGLLTSSLRPIHEWTEHAGPARVLAEVAAKRTVLDHHDRWQATLHETPEGWTPGGCTAYRMAMQWNVRLLAQPYAEHPDFDPAWRIPPTTDSPPDTPS